MNAGQHILCAAMAVASITVVSGCANTLYDWGRYELSVYELYSNEFDLQTNLEVLTQEVKETRDGGGVVPPGKMAHIGYLHSLAGNVEAAVRSFEAEKAAFLESAVFMDFLIAKIEVKRPEDRETP